MKYLRIQWRALPAVAGVGALLAAGVQAAVSPAAQAAMRPAIIAASAAPRVPADATRTGEVPAGQSLHLDVALKVRDQRALTAYLNGLGDRKSPYFHRFLAKGQFGPMFGPTLDQVAAVEDALRAAGLTPGPVTDNRLIISVTGTAAQVERAFGVRLTSYQLPGGRTAFANDTPPRVDAAVAPLLDGILGLDNLYPPRPASSNPLAPAGVRPASLPTASPARPAADSAGAGATGPKPCAAAISGWPLGLNVWADRYGMTPLYGLGDFGQGQKVALVELEPDATSDIAAFKSCYGISTAINYIPVDGGLGAGTGHGSLEATLDIEVLSALAPQATVDVYQAPDAAGTTTGIEDILSQFATNDSEATLSDSWNRCEARSAAATLQLEQSLILQADAQGQTVLGAAMDAGSTGCYYPGNTTGDGATLSIAYPAASPYAVSVGGTGRDEHGTEVTWNESTIVQGSTTYHIGAGGGGISRFWCMPDYQYQPTIPGMFGAQTTTSPACVDSVDQQGYLRSVPDVSANAAVLSGWGIYWNGTWQGAYGTSGAAPLWAAIAALTNASPFCAAYGAGTPGVWPQALYFVAALKHSLIYGASSPMILRDITSGNNDYTPSGYTGGRYPATAGYDAATGLGTPLVSGVSPSGADSTYYPGYAAKMCQVMGTKLRSVAVTGVSPGAGPAGKAATVTVRGSGFLPIAGANVLDVFSGSTLLAALTPSCTTTACTATLPAEPAGTTVDLRISVEDGGFTPAIAADRYTYVAAPHITSLSPAHGTKNGGTKVTIKGTGFTGVKSVTFGGKAGTKVTVSDPTTLTVIAPAGPEGATAKVAVTTAGGTSNSVGYLYADTPHITSVSPAKGSHNGGTKVTIKGTSFAGVKFVTFGGKPGSKVTVTGPTTLTVIAPKGTTGAKVTVAIIAAAGPSNSVAYLYT
jgi:subtilase family serine protease